MHLNLFPVFVAYLLLVWLSQSAYSQVLGSFYHGKGPGVVVHDPSTGNFLYNVYTNNGFSDMQTLTVKTKPKNGTAIACSGYVGPQSVYGQVFYQAQNDSIAFLFFKCSLQSGICINYGEHIISANVTVPVSPKTKLGAALFSNNIGYRVTYQDIHGSIRQVAYANSSQGVVTDWAEGNLTGNFTVPDGYALATSIRKPTNITSQREIVYQVMADGVQPITSRVDNKTMSIHDQKTWFANPLITSFPNFIPAKTTLATLLYNGWDCIFYIDTNRQLQMMRSADGGTSWSLQPQELPTAWPLADEPNGPIAAAASFNLSDYSAYVYYISGKKIVQAKIQDSIWLPVSNIDRSATVTNSSISLNPSHPTDPHTNTTAIKIGAGTGSSVFLLIVAIVVFRIRRKKRQLHAGIETTDSIFEYKNDASSDGGFTGKAELPGQPAHITELDHDPECLLLHQLQLRRLGELRAGVPGELAGKDVERGELDAGLCSCELEGGGGEVFELASPDVDCELLGCLGREKEKGGVDVVTEKCGNLVAEGKEKDEGLGKGEGAGEGEQCGSTDRQNGLEPKKEEGSSKSIEGSKDLPALSEAEREQALEGAKEC